MSFKITVKKQPVQVFSPSLLHTLDNPNPFGTSGNDWFGRSVSLSGNYCMVSGHGEDEVDNSSSGKLYIFNVTTGSLFRTLDNPNAYDTPAFDQFGQPSDISGNYAIVAASWEDDAGGTFSGKVYIFNVVTGVLLHTLDNPNPFGTSQDDYFGWSVAISGNYCIVSARYENDASGTSSGKAYIFSTTTGNLLHTLDNPNPFGTSQDDYFGWSVAISGNYAIVGAYAEDDASGTTSGKAYIYNVTTGSLLHTLDNPNDFGTSADDQFGRTVSISNNYAIVGAWLEDESGSSDSGKAYIFSTTTGDLLHTLDNPNAFGTSANDNFGYRVSISDTHCIVGSWSEDDASGTESGKAYIFNNSTGVLVATLDNPNPFGTSEGDRFTIGVDISDNYAIVGAYAEDDASGISSGKAYIYSLT